MKKVRVVRMLAMLGLALGCVVCRAASINVQVIDAAGQPVANSVVYAEPSSGQTAQKSLRTVEIEQKNRGFFPLVTAIQAGTSVSFPNNDTVRHQVYSFSPAKSFEIKIYAGVPANPILFDKPGTVVVGCNIHDKMIAYIHVVDTPYFAKTDAAGKARLDGVTSGKYRLKAWHFTSGAQIAEQPVNLTGSDVTASLTLNFKANTVEN